VSAEAYSAKHLKHKLLDRYGHKKLFAEVNGHADVVCFRGMNSYFISNKCYAERKTNTQEESEQIVCTACKLIASALRDLNLDTDHFLMTDRIWSLSQGEKSPPRRAGVCNPGNQSCPSNIMYRFSGKSMSADGLQTIESTCSFYQ